MNDQSQIMNQQPQPQMMTQQPPLPPQKPPQMMTHHPQMMMNQPPMMAQRSYGMWPPPPVPPMNYPNPKNPMNPQGGFVGSKPRNWKGKKGNDKRRMDNKGNVLAGSGSSCAGGGYRPPALNELQHQNRMKARRFFNPKKKFNNRFAPYAPRNTTSFLIRAKKSGGIASLVSPCPVTPAVLPTPIFSPSREVLGDMAKEEWGVDGYGSMKGLIRLRSPGGDHDGEDEEDGGSSSDSDVEEHVEVERRLDHDLSRFEMIYPNYGGADYNNVLENRVDDQDTHIAQLEEENLILKERLFLMEREMGDLRRRLQYLERHNSHTMEEINEEVVDNVSENDSESRDNGHSMDGHNEDNRDDGEEVDGKEHGSYGVPEDNCARDVCMDEFVVSRNQHKDEVFTENPPKDEGFTENQPKDEVFTKNQFKDEVFTENLSKDDVFTRSQPKDEVLTENQPEDEVFTENHSKDEVFTENQFKDEVFTENLSKDDVFTWSQPKDEVLTENQPKDEVFAENQCKDEQEENFCVEKSSEVNDDVSMECATNVQVGVAEEKDEPKNAED